MIFKTCEACGQYIRNTKGKQKTQVINKLCDLMGWDKLDWSWKIKNSALNYDMLTEIVRGLEEKGEK